MFELRDAQCEVAHRLTRSRTELGCRARRVRPAALAEPGGLAAPAVEEIGDDGSNLVPLDAEPQRRSPRRARRRAAQ